MQKYADVVLDRKGNVVPGASVRVNTSTGTDAVLYSNNGTGPISNPITTDNLGRFAFYAANNRYNLQVSIAGALITTSSDILLEDPMDETPEVIKGGTIKDAALTNVTINGEAPATMGALQEVEQTVAVKAQTAIDAAEVASTKAVEASDSATIASEKANTAVESDYSAAINSAAAENAADRSESASFAAAALANPFTNTSDGLVATSGAGPTDRFFSVPASDSTLFIIYRNDAGVAFEIGRAPSDKSIKELGFQNMPVSANDMGLAIADKNRRSSWVQVGLDGKPTKYTLKAIGEGLNGQNAPVLVENAASEALIIGGFKDFDAELNGLSISISDSKGRRSDLEMGLDGHFSDRVVQLLSARIGAAAVVPSYPENAIACWGDSLTAGGWPTTLAGLSGLDTYNGGWGGQGYSQIAARQGGVPARLTIAGDIIPASGSVAVTAFINNPLSDGGNRQGTLSGVLGNLVMTGGALTFTRVVAGDAVECPAKSYFSPSESIAYVDRHITIWLGRNSFKDVAPAVIVAAIKGMIDYLTPRVKRAVVMSIPPWVGEEFGTANRTKLDTCNAAIAAAFPEYWLDISAWLRTTAAATAAGITFTADDLTDIASGLTPRSLRSDDGHLNAPGNLATGTRVYQEFQTRGWM